MRAASITLALALLACDEQPRSTLKGDERDQAWVDSSEEPPVSVPYDESEGLRFKYWSEYESKQEKAHTFESFSGRHDVVIPQDFVDLVGDTGEGGFDGVYRVRVENGKSIDWWRLCSFSDLTNATAEQREDVGAENFVDRILEQNRELFSGAGGTLRFVPFGLADWADSADRGGSGFLVFDVEGRVLFVAKDLDLPVPVAESFREMLAHAVFVHYG